jgi:hypothetical protein
MEEHAAVADWPGTTEPGSSQTLAAGAGPGPARQQGADGRITFGLAEEGGAGASEAQAGQADGGPSASRETSGR